MIKILELFFSSIVPVGSVFLEAVSYAVSGCAGGIAALFALGMFALAEHPSRYTIGMLASMSVTLIGGTIYGAATATLWPLVPGWLILAYGLNTIE